MEIKAYVRKTNYYETDQMGIIHHSNYIRYFEEARVFLMEQMGYNYEKASRNGIDFAVLEVSCEYKSMVRFGDTVSVYACISEITAARISINYVIRDSFTEELRTTGKTRHCYYSNIKKCPVSLKKELPELFELLVSIKMSSPPDTGKTSKIWESPTAFSD